MGLLSSEVISNRWDVENSINDAMNKTAMSWGQLDRTKYAPMTASTALQGDMYGRSMGSMLGGQDPMLAKQDIVDDIMSRYPDPDTPEELDAIVAEFSKAGMPDHAFQIQQVSTELKSALKTSNTPSKTDIEGIVTKMESSFLHEGILDEYMNIHEADYISNESKGRDGYTASGLQARRKARRGELTSHFKSFADHLRRKGVTTQELNAILNNESVLLNEFTNWLKYNANSDTAAFWKQRLHPADVEDVSGAVGLKDHEKAELEQYKILLENGGRLSAHQESRRKELLERQNNSTAEPETTNTSMLTDVEQREKENLQRLEKIGNLSEHQKQRLKEILEKEAASSQAVTDTSTRASIPDDENSAWWFDSIVDGDYA